MNKKTLAHIFSWLFLPLLMPFYGLYLSLYIPSNEVSILAKSMHNIPFELKRQLLIIFFLFSTIAPSISFIALYRRKIITSIDIENQNERLLPLFIMFSDNILPKYLYALPLSGVIVTAVFIIINKWIKISLHSGGAGVLVGYLMIFMKEHTGFPMIYVLLAIIASGLTISARLYLAKHSTLEVYSAWLLAATITYSCCHFYPI
jgi:hypothetical protein